MPHSQEKIPEPIAELPNPELNPLLNPTLGRNLGRWAEVYFTSPPEKRAEAVVELLRELKASPQLPTGPTPAKFETTEITSTTEKLPPEPVSKCAECGHIYTNPQRFCGMCGAPMGTEYSGYRPAELPLPQEFVFPQGSIFGMTITPSNTAPPSLNDGSDVRWLREKNLAGNADESSLGRVPKYAPAVLAIVAIGVLIYAQSRPAIPPSKPAAPVTVSQRPSESQPTTPSEGQRAQSAPSTDTAASKPTQEASHPPQTTPAESPSPAQPETPLPKPTLPVARPAAAVPQPPADGAKPAPQTDANDSNAGNGSQELALAEEYLNGRRGPRDSAEAAKFLWKAVGKENPSAILLLSDMYLVGDGVPKSCDQARLLLNAAVRKNVPQAAQKLHNLLNSGCH